MTKMNLTEIACIRAGQTIPGGLVDDPYGDYYAINSKAIEGGKLNKGAFVRLQSREVTPYKWVDLNDILLCAKSTSNRAILFQMRQERVIAAAYFHILTVKDQAVILPKYLCWFLNHPKSQEKLAGLAHGSTMRSITKRAIEHFPINVPDIGTQQQIIGQVAEVEKERLLTLELLSKKKLYHEQRLYRLSQQGGESEY